MPFRSDRFAFPLCLLLLAAAHPAVARPAAGNDFTVAVVSDPQHYSDIAAPQPRGAETFALEMRYLVDQRAAKNLAFVSFVGDIVQHGDGQFREQVEGGPAGQLRSGSGHAEWDIADRAIAILSHSSIPFGMSPGNHDYDNAGWWTGPDSPGAPRPLSGGRVWESYFGPQSHHFAGKPWYGGAFNHGLNSYQIFTGGGKRFLHLSLEMEPAQTVLDWAQHIIDRHPGLPVIMTTHEWLNPEGVSDGTRLNDHDTYFAGSDHLPTDAVWDRFVRKNPAIFLVLCGHKYIPSANGISNGENLQINRNDAGYPVYQVLQDYQGNTVGPDGRAGSANGGAGWLRFITFDTKRHKLRFSTYSPLLRRYAGRAGEATFGIPAAYSDFELDFPPQLLK